LLEDIPELREFFGLRLPKKVLISDNKGDVITKDVNGIEKSFPIGIGNKGNTNGIPDIGIEPGSTIVQDAHGNHKASTISRSSKQGPKISFVNVSDKLELAWVEGNTIFINNGHPVNNKIKDNYKDKRIFYLVAIGCAIQRFLASQEDKADLLFIDRILSAWGNK